MKAITARDWQRMSWHQRKRVLDRYAKEHRPADHALPRLSDTECPTCGGRKSRTSDCCQECAIRNRRTEKLAQILDMFRADPMIVSSEIARRLGYSEPSPVYRLLRRNGHKDVADQLKTNALIEASVRGMKRRTRRAA